MYIVIRRYRMDPDNIDDVIDLVRNRLLPAIITIPGFKGFYEVHSAEDCLLSVNIFADKAGADLSNSISRELVKELASDILPLPPEIIQGDVVTSEVMESLITPKPAML